MDEGKCLKASVRFLLARNVHMTFSHLKLQMAKLS